MHGTHVTDHVLTPLTSVDPKDPKGSTVMDSMDSMDAMDSIDRMAFRGPHAAPFQPLLPGGKIGTQGR